MSKILQRLFRVQPGETALLLTLGVLLFSNSFALETADVVATSGFLSSVSVPNILLVWIIDMTLIILMGGFASLVVDRYPRARLMGYMSIIIGVIYIILRLLFMTSIPDWLNYALLFLIAEQQWLFFPLIFWVLASDVFTMAQSKRLFPLMTAVGFIGQIAGVALAASAPTLFRNSNITDIELLSLNALIYFACFLIVHLRLRKVRVRETAPHKAESVREILSEGWDFIKNVPAFYYLTISLLGISAAITIFEFHFFVVANDVYSEAADFQAFYGLYRLVLVISSMIVTAIFTSRIIEKAGLKNTFAITPIFCMGVAIAVLISPAILMSTLAILLSKTMFTTIDQSARKSFQSLVPEERRGRVSTFLESYVVGGGVIVGAVLIGITLIIFNQVDIALNEEIAYLALGLLTTILGVLGIFRMRKVYDKSLLNWRLKRRQRRSSVLDQLDFS